MIPTFSHPPQRVVSLVPSLTESMFDLGLGATIVGITDYCIHPADKLTGLPRLGGPKNPRLGEVLGLRPDLVLANQEENTRQAVEALQAAGVPVWVSFPQTVRQSLDLLWSLADVFHSPQAAVRLQTLEHAVQWAAEAARAERRQRYFCPIWYDHTGDGQPWWMTFNRFTYCHDLLDLLGGENIFAQRERRYPLSADLGKVAESPSGAPSGHVIHSRSSETLPDRDTRYPRVTLDEIRQADPELILLPDEPYVFGPAEQAELEALLPDCAAVRLGRVYIVDGSLVTWQGTRLGKALSTLLPLFTSKI